METKKEREPVFPPGFEHVEERLRETLQRLEQIEEQIRNRPKEKGPPLEYRPPLFVGRLVPAQQDKERIALQAKQHEIRMEMLKQTEADTRDVDGKAGRMVRDAVRERLFPNPYRTLSKENRLSYRNVDKEIEQSSDFIDAMLQPKQIDAKELIAPPVSVPEATKQEAALSMSARFSMSLSYTKVTQQEIGRDRNKEIDKDRD